MGRIRLHRVEHDKPFDRLVGMTITVLLFAFLSCFVVQFLAANLSAVVTLGGTAGNGYENYLSETLPLAAGLVLVPALAALTVGAHTLQHGGLLGFAASLFQLLPLPGWTSTGGPMHNLQLFVAFMVGALLAFYLGDLGSWLCRQRLVREAKEDIAIGLHTGEIDPAWDGEVE